MGLANSEEEITQEEKFINDFGSKLYKQRREKYYEELVFLCIGTDKITGDCFGPLVGTKLTEYLKEYNIFNINIYGDLENPINYENVNEKINVLNKYHHNACIIVIDAALSKKENIGNIYVSNEKTVLGNVLNKKKYEIGDISIKAVVGRDFKIPKYNFLTLQNISLNMVMKLANIVSEGICDVIKYG